MNCWIDKLIWVRLPLGWYVQKPYNISSLMLIVVSMIQRTFNQTRNSIKYIILLKSIGFDLNFAFGECDWNIAILFHLVRNRLVAWIRSLTLTFVYFDLRLWISNFVKFRIQNLFSPIILLIQMNGKPLMVLKKMGIPWSKIKNRWTTEKKTFSVKSRFNQWKLVKNLSFGRSMNCRTHRYFAVVQ